MHLLIKVFESCDSRCKSAPNKCQFAIFCTLTCEFSDERGHFVRK